jgi:hypothetical protein
MVGFRGAAAPRFRRAAMRVETHHCESLHIRRCSSSSDTMSSCSECVQQLIHESFVFSRAHCSAAN